MKKINIKICQVYIHEFELNFQLDTNKQLAKSYFTRENKSKMYNTIFRPKFRFREKSISRVIMCTGLIPKERSSTFIFYVTKP